MAMGSGIEGGWSFTCYSNAEGYAMSAITRFAGVFEQAGMDNAGVYPGNARNSMIQRYTGEDRNYIEKGNVALLESHGNPWGGPDLEYVPRVSSWSNFEWGDRGRLQWAAIGGCDVLGFATHPDGRIARYSQPMPDRWDGMLAGASGLLGFRSASYYSKTHPGIGGHLGGLFAQELLNGRTFYESWVIASDYAHRVFNKQAEVAVFVTSPEALRDTLTSYAKERLHGVDIGSIRRTIVGSGAPPKYDYCHLVDNSGAPSCPLIAQELQRLDETVWVAQGVSLSLSELPVFVATPNQRPLLKSLSIKSQDQYSGNPYHCAFGNSKDAQDAFSALADRHGVLITNVEAGDRTASRSIVVGENPHRVFADFGVVAEQSDGQAEIRYTQLPHVGASIATRPLPMKLDQVAEVIRQFGSPQARIVIEDVSYCYAFKPRTTDACAVPGLALTLRVEEPWGVQHLVEFI